ncbi:MAG TPA: glycosyltransferase, partial [Patescibacteria group bacterium]|nr:glycosyltransferase [Patescibacteria group bacterium]
QALYSRASLFVYPSFYEGFGLPPLEAMSYGVPVVASGAGSLGEILGNSALLVQPYQVSEISVAMEALLGDQRLRDLYIQRGFLAAKKYRWEDAAKQLLGVFERVVDKLN